MSPSKGYGMSNTNYGQFMPADPFFRTTSQLNRATTNDNVLAEYRSSHYNDNTYQNGLANSATISNSLYLKRKDQ